MRLSHAKRKLGQLYDRYGDRLRADRLLGPWENRAPDGSAEPYSAFSAEGELPPIEFLVATSDRGLLWFRGSSALQLFGDAGFYGLTRQGPLWYAFHKAGLTGRLLRFRLGPAGAEQLTVLAYGLSRGVHQIDFVHGNLVATDTYNNRLLVFDPDTTGPWRRHARVHYPDGRLRHGRASVNYRHFNSLFAAGKGVFLLAHNETLKTERESELYRLDADFEVVDVRSLRGSNCHNIYVDEEREIYCRSGEGTVAVNGEDALSTGLFTRGLSLAEDYHLVGASGVEPLRELRAEKSSKVIITKPDFEVVAEILVPGTQVNEIRRVDRLDLGLGHTGERVARVPATAARRRVAGTLR